MSNKTRDFYRFGDFRLDARKRVLYHDERHVALKPKAIETLIALIENGGEVVSKDELLTRVWRDSFVEENTLSVNIYALRKAFAALDAGKSYIETVPRRGFRFVFPVKEETEEIFDEKPLIEEFAVQKETEKPETENFNKIEKTAIFIEPKSEISNSNRTFSSRLSWQSLAAIVLLIVCVLIGGAFYGLRKQTATGGEASQSVERGTKNVEALQYYLRGRELWQTRSNAKMEEGIAFFRRAIELDPSFVAPYLGIADSLSMMRNDAEEWRQAEEYVRKALAIAPGSADAHASLGFILAMNKWEWQAAEQEFRLALRLDADCAKAHQWYATLLMIQRRFPESEAHLKRAIEIEPLSPNYNADLSELYFFAKRFDEALAQTRRTQEINPDFHYANVVKNIYINQKRFDEAAQEWLKSEIRSGLGEEEAQKREWFQAYKRDGFRGWIKFDIKRFEKYPDSLLGAYQTGVAYAQTGEREKSLEYLEKAFAGRALLFPFANAQPEFDFMRGDARFQNLMRRTGLNQ